MSRRSETIPADYFDAMYRADPDPWRFRSSDYEAEKYRATLGALRHPRYRRGLEVGCAIGILTRQLAERCDALLSIDGSSVAIEAARAECQDCPQVRFEERMIPDAFPPGRFDLIILSEVLYYLHPADLTRTAQLCMEAIEPDGDIVLCHWLGETDYPLTGEEAASGFLSQALTRRPSSHVRLHDGQYRLDRLSVA